MEKFSHKNEALAVEMERIKRDLAILEATEGFARLTPRQQQIIRTSLFLQARAERDMHPNHKNDPWYYDWFKRSSHVPEYQESLSHVKHWYCHAAIASLESGQLSGDIPPEHPDSFFNAAYFVIHDIQELKQAISFFDFPTVVHVNSDSDNLIGEVSQYHSFLVLGYDQEKNIVVWEKEGFSYPYRITTLKQVYVEYNNFRYWGVRKLR